jgi:RNA 2',3'-cyclic 3'-phosphodiesterase
VSDRPKVRLFAAVELPADVRTAIEVATAPLRPTIAGFRWVPAENLHLTLVFLGWVHPDDVEPVRAVLGTAVAPAGPFTARLGAAGRFPDRGKARVLWVGFASGGDALTDLACRAREAVADRVPDARPFRPHITIARAKQPVRLTAASLGAVPSIGRDVVIEAVTLFRSHLGSPHPRYEPIARLGLQGGPSAG